LQLNSHDFFEKPQAHSLTQNFSVIFQASSNSI